VDITGLRRDVLLRLGVRLGKASTGERRRRGAALRKCWIFPVEVPFCTSVTAALLCGRAMTALPHRNTSVEEASVQERAASEQSEVSSWVPRQAAALVRQR